ncbi:uncharacterized protein LOC101851889 [Aplysia californica]|uniref:Uncharacterized protein LOC101851889 n=1 Tax=Aplysia californica TaxID=6500 RepID=A0ABM0K0X5_APLCA|nr:uncharacterized protein LOC101851889 [Aplysia californica]
MSLWKSTRRWVGVLLSRRISLNFLSIFLLFFITVILLMDAVRHQLPRLFDVQRHLRHTDASGAWLDALGGQDGGGAPSGWGCSHRKGYVRHMNYFEDRRFNVHNSLTEQEGQVCKHPELDPCDPQIIQFDRSADKVNCSIEEDWVYVDNGTFRISGRARRKYGKIICEYAPLVRGLDDYSARHAEHVKPMLDGTPLLTDFFKVACISPSGKRYHSIHAGVAYNRTLHERGDKVPLPPQAMGYDVFMFGFDSVSRMSWYRNLPKTRDYFVRMLGGMELEGYNIVGDGTVQALLPILAGNHERELPTARRGEPGSVFVDGFPWIWNDFREAGYVTAWAEDMAHIGTFQLRLNGFKKQPTDHSMRTYFLLAEAMYKRFEPFCVGSTPRHKRFQAWFRDLYTMYGGKRKFMFGFHSEFSHENNSDLKAIDDDMVEFLKNLNDSGFLNRTILILMSDHGARFSAMRNTSQGKLEERMPYFGFRFPPSFTETYPEAVNNFQINRRRLTTPFDIHATFHDILKYTGPGKGDIRSRGISLFKEVPKERSCADADVEPHWCACLDWHDVSEHSDRRIPLSVINFINRLTSHLSEKCARLTVKDVKSIYQISPNSQVLKFKKSADLHGDVPDLSDSMTSEYEYFLVTLMTSPGDGLFEVTVKHSIPTDSYEVNERGLSRINRYGNAPRCIQKEFPNLRPYCYCI